ncbi:DUF6049 family protein [Brachybacterium sp. FME24]|uniref:DUF6049 family protein n=1 Tax=Brachybacterium sp. FME24 TaxID=2742605 RepID=UPI001868828E|nr:DUF6049 family protein [Brachybacterium sp. FME24]
MPSSPLPVRPVLAALLTALLMASSVLVGGPATLLPAARAAGGEAVSAAPAAPPQPAADTPVSMDLVSLTPTSLDPDGTVEAQVEVTNTSSQPVPAVSLELRTRTSRVTDRAVLADWQADSTPDTSGAALATSTESSQLDPGESTTLTVEATTEELDYSTEPYYWGTRRLSLTVVSDEDPLSAIRSFVVWRPEGADDTITQSVLLPVAAQDASAPVTDPDAHRQSVESGRLASLRQLALRDDVDWWLDPALVDPPLLPVQTEDPETPDPEDEAEPTVQPPREYQPSVPSAEIATALVEGVGDRTVLAMPYAQADLVSLQDSDSSEMLSAAGQRAQTTWDETGIAPLASAMRVQGPTADADTLQGLVDAEATAAIVPSASLRPDLAASVTPSSVSVYESADGSGSELPLLAPDPVLSDEFSLLTADSDTEQTRQRLLAETATIASEYATAPRHLLISPDPDAELDPGAAGATLDALAEAPWIRSGRTSALLDAAAERTWTTDAQNDGDELYALGGIGDAEVQPSAPGEKGRWEHLDESADPQLLKPDVLAGLGDTWDQMDTLASVMEDDSLLDAPRLEVLAATSVRWRGHPDVPASRARDAAAHTQELKGRIEVVPASGYNLISDSVGVPITVTNGLDTPITVHTHVSSDRPLVRVGETKAVEVPAQGQVDVTVPVEAIANGTVTLTTVLTTQDGRPLTEPVDVPLTVNPAWENWTTLLVVIAMGVLVVVGVARARRTGAATRAPAVHGPEDPVELSRTGRSTTDTGAGVRAGTGTEDHHPPARADDAPPDPPAQNDPSTAPHHTDHDHPEEDPR